MDAKILVLRHESDGPQAIFDALMYLKAGRALQVPVALEVSRSGAGAHTWVFFTSPVPAEMARRLGTGLLREAMAIRGRMRLASYDRLFPSQDLLPAGGVGNLIAAPLFRPARRNGATVFLDLETLEPHKDQWVGPGNFGFEAGHYDVSRACGERVLLPAVCEAAADTLVLADGSAAAPRSSRPAPAARPVHLAEILAAGLRGEPVRASRPTPPRPADYARLTGLAAAGAGAVAALAARRRKG